MLSGKFGFVFTLFLNGILGFSQSHFFLTPQSLLSYEADQATISYNGKALQFDLINGWEEAYLLGNFQDHVYIDGNNVYLSQGAFDYLGLDLPKLKNINITQNSSLRLAFELEGQIRLSRYIKTGTLTADETLTLTLPTFLVPWGIPQELEGVKIEIEGGLKQINLKLTVSQPMRYRVFSFHNPSQLVIDFTPFMESDFANTETTTNPSPTTSATPFSPIKERLLPVTPTPRPPFPQPSFALERPAVEGYTNPSLFSKLTERKADLRPGVRYRRFIYPTEGSLSMVHLLEIAPYAGELRVVGESKVPHTISELASGGFAAINASYFDPQTFSTIGFLQLDYKMLSEPSRNRASIAFDRNRAIIDRVYYQASVNIRGKRYIAKAPYQGGELTLYTRAGESFGNPERGTIVVADNRVIENATGLRVVPQRGFIISYELTSNPSELVSVRVGEYIKLEVDIAPRVFTQLRYAVEAGPLLVYAGQNAYEPSKEHFRDTYIVNGRTLQAAVGIKADGTILLLTASSMTAKELVPLFISLGAERAMRLDSGSSTSLFAAGQLLNRWNEKRLVSAIVFFPYQ